MLTGKVSNPTSDVVALALYPNPVSPEEVLKEVVLDKDNRFRIELESDQPVTADLVYDEEVANLFLQPGDELEVSFKASNFAKTLKFKGKGANENNYLAKFVWLFEENDYYQVLPENIYFREKDFVKFLDYRKQDQLENYRRYVKKNPVSEVFKTYALSEIEYIWANDKLTYQNLREYIVLSEPRLQLSESYYDFLKTIRVDNQDAAISPAYRSFMRLYLEHQTDNKNLKKGDLLYYKATYELAKQAFQHKNLQLILARVLNESLRNGPLKYSEEMLADYKTLNPKPEVVQYLTEVYNQNKFFALGSIAPDFELTSVTGEKVKLSDFIGKTVYLNFWTTSCGLCLIDQPYAQHLAEKMEGENVVFLNIAVDDDEEAWRKMVTKKNLKGVHVISKADNTQLLEQYQVKNLPSYYLIGEDGTFINTKPKRPSSNEAVKEIQAAINKKM
ncbi:MAG: TlpA family protein disulfide reductase [Hymenobacteraceae bacterium]|nr:TlpA family protein disulfide reductase [Hymenobacteraceae bacterium]MDX5396378.1 TlpA family protein disulfide reductase [Hymenobacteraceae bacterium]MDX5512440.1 TlpA family protein disulfide reductase [Hymenobacteraceae bacterium]